MNKYYSFILLLSFLSIHAWEHELTTDVIQKYQAPTSLIREIANIKINGVLKHKKYYLKSDSSRIIGVERLKAAFVHSHYDHFKTPEKFLVPVVDKKGRLKFDQSYVISRIINANSLKILTDELLDQFLDVTSQTQIYDFAQRNMLQDKDKVVWFIDTQILYKTDYLSAAAEAILDSHQHFQRDGYSISVTSQKKLLGYIANPISIRRFKDLPIGTTPFDCE